MAAVDALLGFLDGKTPDPDLEPSLGSLHGYGGDAVPQERWAYTGSQDLEADVHDEPHDAGEEGNDEPSLAHGHDLNQEQATRNITGQRYAPGSKTVWHGHDQDLEVEHDGREPSLGALNANSSCQLRWGSTGTDDLEEQCEDEGVDTDTEGTALDRGPC